MAHKYRGDRANGCKGYSQAGSDEEIDHGAHRPHQDGEANGQGDLKGKIFRIGHIGWFDIFDITTALAAVELVLADAGAEIERGVAVTRALEAWAEHTPV